MPERMAAMTSVKPLFVVGDELIHPGRQTNEAVLGAPAHSSVGIGHALEASG